MNILGDLNNITDPLDFKDTKVPKLFEIDSLLRCHICKEFLSAPMLTNCGHTFCSVCIRKYLIHTPKCPICSKELRESNLCRNVLLEQTVLSYKNLRPDLLENLQIPKEIPQISNSESKEQDVEVIENIDDDDDVVIIEEPKKRKSEANNIGQLFKKQKEKQPGKDKSRCPICQKIFHRDILEQTTHIDTCSPKSEHDSSSLPNSSLSPSSPKKKQDLQTRSSTSNQNSPAPSSISFHFQPKEPTTDLKKLTKLDFSSLSNSALKQRLTKLELPVTGTRNQMEARYNEYLILWNANCDSINPKNPKILRKSLSQWENSLKFKNNSGDDKQLDKNSWNQLISQAKKSALKVKKDNKDEEDDEKNDTNVDLKGNDEVQETNDPDESFPELKTSSQEQFFNA
ncbi:Postreplication repair E3 ubiquitin-protein ligase RAD18 [Wickerhamomyces ciferrii]|uniref:Postreplication repair E3 ubiquitin-protein ligase RAD18 n=1 Tax=Wickerhamomyces ciferrii (strain ATCC 14091 / BCRC 22168 / CBS 111 / JCM 3599 / NBRC 0793 / NRRL Y-1031 F-60-10) TaxID=1206466 RepID=K0KKK9_WICCF|nr:Postreplication repair E3 ubiquitin-protein ligase RAD18 [Wickerhamomyces ciferrii]CCH42004.1 Postreplication repair E3 ubiquitin-protein ligase RAD18 [Wickerhamomyces ciferrii]